MDDAYCVYVQEREYHGGPAKKTVCRIYGPYNKQEAERLAISISGSLPCQFWAVPRRLHRGNDSIIAVYGLVPTSDPGKLSYD